MTFRAPVADIAFALKHGAGFTADGLDESDIDAILTEAGRFATDVIGAELVRDEAGAVLEGERDVGDRRAKRHGSVRRRHRLEQLSPLG